VSGGLVSLVVYCLLEFLVARVSFHQGWFQGFGLAFILFAECESHVGVGGWLLVSMSRGEVGLVGFEVGLGLGLVFLVEIIVAV